MRPLTALLVVAMLALAGCGGDDDDGEPAVTEPAVSEQQEPSNAEVITRADAICSQAKVAIDMARSKFHHGNFDQASEAELETFVADRIVPVYENEISSLRKLPGADAGELGEILDEAENAVAGLADDPTQINLKGGSALFDQANRLASDYGLSVCVAP